MYIRKKITQPPFEIVAAAASLLNRFLSISSILPLLLFQVAAHSLSGYDFAVVLSYNFSLSIDI